MLRNCTCCLILAWSCLAPSGAVHAGSWVFVSLLENKQIVTFERDEESGRLQRRAVTDCPAEPACMGVAPDRRTLYVSFRSTGELASFHIDGQTGALSLVSVVPGGEDPAYLQPDRSGRYLFSAYYAANKVAVHRLGDDGSISERPWQTIATAARAHGVAVDAENRNVFVPHTGANRIYQFRFDLATGKLQANQPPFLATPAHHHPRHIALGPADRWAYTSDEAGDSLSVYAIDRQAGTLQMIQTASTIPADFDGAANSTARCEATPDRKFVYVANRGHDSIAGFAIDQRTGRVRSLGRTPTEKTPRSFTIAPGGRFLYAAGQASGKLAAFRILPDGKLQRFATYEAGPVAWWAQAVDTP